jgi:hypothetical protein
LAAFSDALRNEVDLQQLREHVLAVVQETIQPAHVSLWLLPSKQREGGDGPGERQSSETDYPR